MTKQELFKKIDTKLGIKIFLEREINDEDVADFLLTENKIILAQGKFNLFTLPNYYNYLTQLEQTGTKLNEHTQQENLLLDLSHMFSTLTSTMDEFLEDNQITLGTTEMENEFYKGHKNFYRSAKSLVNNYVVSVSDSDVESLIDCLSKLIDFNNEGKK